MRPLGTASDVAALLRLPKAGVYARAAEGRLPGVRRIGRVVRFQMDAIEAWVEAGCAEREAWPAAWHPVQLGNGDATARH